LGAWIRPKAHVRTVLSRGENDSNQHSVFTRTLLAEIAVPVQSMVRIAKRTQARVNRAVRFLGRLGYTPLIPSTIERR